MKVAIIPARGGSKRIPRKNIKSFNGKPIIAYSIEAALKSGCFDRVVVSTDDNAIAQVANDYGAETPFIRGEKLSDDFTGTNDVVADAIGRIEGKIDLACCIYATAPFVTAEVIREGLEMIENSADADFAVTVTSFPFPVQRALTLDSDKALAMREPEHLSTRSQDLEEMFHDAGQIYWGTSEAFTNSHPLFAGKTLPIIRPTYLVQDIDTPEDWIRAEALYKVLMDN